MSVSPTTRRRVDFQVVLVWMSPTPLGIFRSQNRPGQNRTNGASSWRATGWCFAVIVSSNAETARLDPPLPSVTD